ncbi:MAG: AmmeMemoRadiSam system radical SAM enzyme [bacterium]
MIKPAAYSQPLGGKKVRCLLCPAECLLTVGKIGICKSRFNRDGELVTDNYGELVSLAVDPIEKKPLYHFYPMADILSTGPNSCNLGCLNCQNWTISHKKTTTVYYSPDKLTRTAESCDSLGVAFTYTEPLVWFEYLMDTAPLLQRAGLKTVLVSNGYISPEPLEDLLPFIDAVNVDLKSIRPAFYKKICKAKLQPVLTNIRRLAAAGIHLEITNLLIPGLNDSDEDLRDLIDFVASVSEMIPLHFSAYHPSYKMKIEATPTETMMRAHRMARQKLPWVYTGNILLPGCSDTRCPDCGELLIERSGFHTAVTGLKNGRCSACGGETGIIR